jgi:hypothetical protein
MANFLEFEIPGQGKVLVKPLTELPQGAALASRGGISAQASKTFAESLKGLPEIAQNVFSAVKATATPPSEIEVDFNVAFSGEADLVIHNDVDGPAGAVARELREVQHFCHESLTCKGSVAMH